MADARVVANRLIELARQDGDSLTPMQLLKLVYIAHGFRLGLRGVPLIHNPVQAWKYGPVIPDLYRSIRDYRDQPVPNIATGGLTGFDGDERTFVDAIYKAYRGLSGIQLSQLTHQPGTPWDQVYDPRESFTPIPNDLIEDHYRETLCV